MAFSSLKAIVFVDWHLLYAFINIFVAIFVSSLFGIILKKIMSDVS